MDSHTQVVKIGTGAGRIAVPVSNENPLPVVVSGANLASDGASLPIDSLPQSLAYDGAGRLSGVSVAHDGVTYTKAIEYDAEGRPVAVSAWEAQP